MKKIICGLMMMAFLASGLLAKAQTAAPSPSMKPAAAKKRKHHKLHTGAVHKKKTKGTPEAAFSNTPTK
jgi:hypothetical protein